MEVLGVKLDFKGYSLFVPNFINGALNRFCDEATITTENVRVVLSFDEKDNMTMWLYNASTYVKQVTLESLFDTKDILTQV